VAVAASSQPPVNWVPKGGFMCGVAGSVVGEKVEGGCTITAMQCSGQPSQCPLQVLNPKSSLHFTKVVMI
jgi:hypothetical protein